MWRLSMNQKLLTAQEAKKYLRIKEIKTLYKYARSGKIPAFKMGKEWRFNMESLNKWVKQQESKNIKKYRK